MRDGHERSILLWMRKVDGLCAVLCIVCSQALQYGSNSEDVDGVLLLITDHLYIALFFTLQQTLCFCHMQF